MSKPLVTLLAALVTTFVAGSPRPAPALEPLDDQAAGHRARVMLSVEDELPLASQIDGRIAAINAREGDRFKRNDILVKMDCRIQRARQKKVAAELDAARQTLAAKQRLVNLLSGSRMESNQAAADVAKAEADLEVYRAVLDMCDIRAPFDGIVVQRRAAAQQYVTKGQPLLEIIDDTTLRARVIVPSTWLLWLRPGQVFSFHLEETGQRYDARIQRIGVRIDTASQTVSLTGVIEGHHPTLRAGMGGMARFSVPGAPP